MSLHTDPESGRLRARSEACPVCRLEPPPPSQVRVWEFPTSWLEAAPTACLKGACWLLLKPHAAELFDLTDDDRAAFAHEAATAARAVLTVTAAMRLDYEIHGHAVPHLRLHLFPRYLDDPFSNAPIDDRRIDPSLYAVGEFAAFVESLRSELGSLTRTIVRPSRTALPADLTLRVANVADLPAIVEIYNQAVALRTATADLHPVTVEGRAAWFAEHDPERHPIFVAETSGAVVGWCSLSPYRPGRTALRHTAEISYYLDERWRRRGLGSALVAHAIAQAPALEVKTLFAILLDANEGSVRLLERAGFRRWGHLPSVADFDGRECGQYYYGLRVPAPPTA